MPDGVALFYWMILVNGYIDALIYVILTAVSFVFLSQMISEINPWVALLIMSGIALVVFNCMNLAKSRVTYRALWKEKAIWLAMTIALAVDWISMVFAGYYSDPFVAMAALFIATAMMGFASLYYRQRKIIYLLSCGLLALVLGLLLIAYTTVTGKSVVIGILLGIIAGVAFYGYIASSAALAIRRGLNSLSVLATRFWGMFLIALVCAKWELVLLLNFRQYLELLLVSLGALIIPIYFNQQAIAKLGAELTAVFISLVPPLTYLIYIIYLGQFNMLNGIICLSITLALLLPKLLLIINNRR